MNEKTPEMTIFVIDDHPDELLLICRATESIGIPVKTFSSPEEFLAEVPSEPAGCIVADLMMPSMNGLQLRAELLQRDITLPIIILTGQADARTCRQALQDGVFDFVEKSWNPFDIVEVIRRGIAEYERQIAERQANAFTRERLSRVSDRERDVMQKLAAGRTQKELAKELGISVQTASKHRGSLFRKLDVTNDVELLRLLMSADSEVQSQASLDVS